MKEYIVSTDKAYEFEMGRFEELQELTRCKDCKHYTGKWCTKFSTKQFDLNNIYKGANDFCSQAERKERNGGGKMRLINADELRKAVEDLPNCRNDYSDTYDKSMILTLVDEAPTVDAVQVIRCKDCRWYKTNYLWDGRERRICAIEAYEPSRKADWFCSRAERKEG